MSADTFVGPPDVPFIMALRAFEVANCVGGQNAYTICIRYAMRLFGLSITAIATLAIPLIGQTSSSEQADFFEKRVRPILVARCQGCHNPKAGTAGLDLTTISGVRKGADSGPVLVPGDVEKSRLMQVIGYQERIKMPPTGKLPDEELAQLRQWVKIGAPWPSTGSETLAAQTQGPKKKGYSKAQKEFWSFRPLQHVTPPEVRNQAWVRSPVDRFILARLELEGLPPAAPADKLALIRRATFDLTGLAPTEEEIRAFVDDPSAGCFRQGG